MINIDDTLIEILKRKKERQEENKKKYKEYYIRYFSDNPIIFNTSKEEIVQPLGKITETITENEVHFLMVRNNGPYISSRTMQHCSRVIHDKLGFKKFNFHSLRHTHSTMLKEAGAPDSYIQKRLGIQKLIQL